MTTRTIVLLANSIKGHARCIAGKELIDLRTFTVGDWIRPVSDHGDGEVDVHESILDDSSQPVLLDIVSVPLEDQTEDPTQPENWRINKRHRWRKRATFPLSRVQSLADHPTDLWMETGGDSDRVSEDYMQANPLEQSLYLIRPLGFEMEIFSELNPDQPYPTRHRRARFSYNEAAYDLPITDPVIDRKYLRPYPSVSEPRKSITPTCGDDCFLCVSLGGQSGGFHSKFVAAVIELGE